MSLFTPLLLAAQVAAAQPAPERAEPLGAVAPVEASAPAARRMGEIFSGRAGAAVSGVLAPKVEDPITIDGILDEPVWELASRLVGFSTYNPVDGRPAQDSTEVLVWYSSRAIHFGIRAFAPPGGVQATLADRDRIANDDWVQILLDTFNDRRRAFMFAVNPYGIQSDGMRSEGAAGPGVNRAALQSSDLSQDFIWESKGRLTDEGYVVELRIPFKSLRFQAGRVQDWGLQVIRNTQRTGYQDVWAPVKRAGASFQVQEGKLLGLTELKRGLVLDVTPVTTALANGTPRPTPDGGWRYASRGQFGTDVRWGVTPNLTMNATANPDFSQVEADVGQIAGDVRFALFFPEQRPFFTEGSEQFDAPGQLVYTRRIVQPVTAAKLTGKLTRADLGVLAAVDNAQYSADGATNPVFGIVRYRKDIGTASNAGVVFTERREGSAFNRVVSTDARLFLTPIYTLNWQLGGSWNEDGTTATGFQPKFDVGLGRTGRGAGFLYGITGVADRFETRSGFVPRNDYVEPRIFQRFSFFGKPGGWWDQYTLFFAARSLWTWDGFGREGALERRFSASNTLTFLGGFSASVTPGVEWFRFDPRRYADLRVATPDGFGGTTYAPFTVGAPLPTRYVRADLRTRQFRRWGMSVGTALSDAEPDFFETALADRRDVDVTLDLRPTTQIRAQALLRHSQFDRKRDGTRLFTTTIPRLRMEYQLTRWAFVRFVGQYERRFRDALRDPETGLPLVRVQDGTPTLLAAQASNRLRMDWLFSFLPNPGTVIFAGYGTGLEEPDAFKFREIERQNDGFFVKFSYLLRAGGLR